MRSQTPERDIPHRSKITSEIVKRAEETVALIALKLKVGTTNSSSDACSPMMS
jgi:hypothetical protein